MATFHREKEVQSSVQELRDRGRPSKSGLSKMALNHTVCLEFKIVTK
jgi:hypothetical protein